MAGRFLHVVAYRAALPLGHGHADGNTLLLRRDDVAAVVDSRETLADPTGNKKGEKRKRKRK